jgi:hypothetical protein
MGSSSGADWWNDLIDEFQDRLVDYFEWGLETIGELQVGFEATLESTEPGTAEHARAADAVTALSRAAIRFRGQLHVARELYDRGLGPLSAEP